MMDERGLKVRALVILSVVVGAVAYVGLLRWYRSNAEIPPVSWTAGLILLVVAGLLVGAGLRIRSTRRGSATRPMHPLGVFRMLRLAQACALAGSVATGWYLALAGVTVPDMAAASMRDLGVSALFAAVAGIVVVLAGMWVQSRCRIDPPDDDRDTATGSGARS